MSRKWPTKFVVGLTGNIATGKSAVLGFAKLKGALTIDADRLVHRILALDADVQMAVEAAFGPSVRREDGAIDRQRLGAIVFNDQDALRRLELIVHPVVRRILYEQVERDDARVVFIEAIKLLEGGLAADCDQVWVTRCSRSTQLQRLIVCRGLDEATAVARIDGQPPQEIKVSAADVVIETDDTMADTERYFRHAWQRIVKQLPAEDADKPALEQSPPGNGREPAGVDTAKKLIVRRAKPADVPSILWLMQQATDGQLSINRSDLLASLGDRGYIIGQEGTTISTVAGWYADNQVASVEEFYIFPKDATEVTGAAVLEEIESTAQMLLCEVILVCRPQNETEELRQLFEKMYFMTAEPADLPKVWQAAAAGLHSDDRSIWMKVLRTTRLVDSR